MDKFDKGVFSTEFNLILFRFLIFYLRNLCRQGQAKVLRNLDGIKFRRYDMNKRKKELVCRRKAGICSYIIAYTA